MRIFIKLGMSVPNDLTKVKSLKKELRSFVRSYFELTKISNDDELLDQLLTRRTINHFGFSDASSNDHEKCLVVTHQLDRTGAPMAALIMARTLKTKLSKHVSVISLADGPMRLDFESEGFHVLMFAEVCILKDSFVEMMNSFDRIFVCSGCYQFLRYAKFIKSPIYWWVHEFWHSDQQVEYGKMFSKHVNHILTGSYDLKKTVDQVLGNNNSKVLIYGVDSSKIKQKSEKSDLIRFALLGMICKRKGSDIFVDAVKLLKSNIRNKAQFIVVGDRLQSEESYYNDLIAASNQINELKVLKSMRINELLEAYSGYDVIVSASRADPMPIVITYGLMFSKLCVCSDGTGTASLIEHGKSGMIFKSENPVELAQIMEAIVQSPQCFELYGGNARKVYEKHLSIENFEEGLKSLIEPVLN